MKIELEQVEPAEIESRSMEIIESELPHEIDPKLAPIIKRAVHTAADFDYVDNLCFSEDVVDKALDLDHMKDHNNTYIHLLIYTIQKINLC